MKAFYRPGSSRFRWRLALFALAALLIHPPAAGAVPGTQKWRAIRGELDLRDWSPTRDGSIDLDGEWAFFPGVLLSFDVANSMNPPAFRLVPDQWRGSEVGGSGGRGAGTYRLAILLPEEASSLGIRYTTLSTAFELDAGGMTIAKAGRPALDRASARAAYAPGVAAIPATAAIPSAGFRRLDLVVRASNHDYRIGGMWRSFSIGAAEALQAARGARLNRSFVLSSAIAAVVLVFLFFFKNRKSDGSFFFFSMLALSVSVRALVTGEYALAYLLPRIPFELLIKLEYLTAYSPLPLAVLFYASIFPDEIGKKLKLALLAPNIPFLAVVPFAPLPFLTRTIYPYYALAFALIVATIALGPFRACVRKRYGGIPIAAGSFVLGASAINDILFSSFILHTDMLLPVGLLVFIIAQASVLAGRFNSAFERGEVLSAELAIANKKLALEIERYRESQARLEFLLDEKDILLKEIHHRVKNSLQIVSSIIGLQSHSAADPAVAEAYCAMRARIRAVSLVHEKLYGLDSSEEEIDLNDYARDLISQLSASHGRNDSTGALSIGVARIKVPADFCIDFGLILTEIVSNAYRHGGAVVGSIRIETREAGAELILCVSDDGPGFPPEFDPATMRSLGYRVISSLVVKRSGSVSVSAGPSPTVRLRLPLPGEAAGDIPAEGRVKESIA
jgi:two-component sensor histidine kinase